MIYLTIKDNKIIAQIHTNDPNLNLKALENKGIDNYDEIVELTAFEGVSGDDIRQYNRTTWTKKTEQEILDELNVDKLEENQIIIFENGEHKIITSFKGKIIYNKNEAFDVKECETHKLPEGFTTKKPLEQPCKFENDEWVIDEQKIRQIKKEQIKAEFEKEIREGSFFSNTLTMVVDCRRNERDNDKQNVEGLISLMERNNMSTTYYKGVSETRLNVTVAQLKNLIFEMEDYAYSVYIKYHTIKEQIKNTSIDNLDTIQWSN